MTKLTTEQKINNAINGTNNIINASSWKMEALGIDTDEATILQQKGNVLLDFVLASLDIDQPNVRIEDIVSLFMILPFVKRVYPDVDGYSWTMHDKVFVETAKGDRAGRGVFYMDTNNLHLYLTKRVGEFMRSEKLREIVEAAWILI